MFMTVFSMSEYDVLSPGWGLDELNFSDRYDYCAQIPLDSLFPKKDCDTITRLLKNGYRFNIVDLPKDTLLFNYSEAELRNMSIDPERFGQSDDDSHYMDIYCRIVAKEAPVPGTYLIVILPVGANSLLFDTVKQDIKNQFLGVLDEYKRVEIMVNSARGRSQADAVAADAIEKIAPSVKTILENNVSTDTDY